MICGKLGRWMDGAGLDFKEGTRENGREGGENGIKRGRNKEAEREI